MNRLSSPGPDGFGPSFFVSFWDTVVSDVEGVFHDFYDGTLDLTHINHTFLVLLPKFEAARSPSDFRPISLQNYIMKAITKALCSRLQHYIHSLVDPDQTGFLPGRRISENIVYAADLLRACHTRRAPTVVFKIDFRKAFDSVNWASLLTVLSARGFDSKWRGWIHAILSSGHTSVLLNNVPGDWILCRNGLRQGDALYPYLFIIIVDVLQRLVRRASAEGRVTHPIDPSLPCPVLQYADDTLILCHADIPSVTHLKSLLDAFALATGLAINFHKSGFIPMHCSDGLCAGGWLRDSRSSSEEHVPAPQLRPQASPTGLSSVEELAPPQHQGDVGDCSSAPSFLKVIVRQGLPTYRAITRVDLGDGRATSFWHDRWCPGGALCFEYAALFSHSTCPNASVAVVALDGLHLQRRLSSVAASQLGAVRTLIRALQLVDAPDRRFMAWGEDLEFSSRVAFRVLFSNGVLCQSSIDIWCSKLPRKIKIFACLLVRDRLITRVNLYAKSCAPSSICASCSTEETTAHIFTSCRRAASTWARLGLGPFHSVDGVLSSPPGASTSVALWKDGLLVLLWQLWKARNNATFNGVDCNACDILSRTADDIMLWSCRYDTPDRALLLETHAFFLSAM
ncbi:uncharacterized protein [Aegilops tauschii subsp. strangulata]|uniref:uncharacterized protein n=1 Tax=Aegilops tauschii subsp. strangulata TaxID=200361 RepID=UPI00098A1E4A|nr:uncharacterized protein LOC109736039 [Aegilops tauschii subsp. strangulata]